MSEQLPEYVVIQTRGSNPPDHLSLDGGATTLCGLRSRAAGGRHQLFPQLFGDKAQTFVNTWAGTFQCRRCAAAAPDENSMIAAGAIALDRMRTGL